jgi:hypothetical protein
MMIRESRRAGVVGDAPNPDRDRVLHQRPEQALALRQVSDVLDHLR